MALSKHNLIYIGSVSVLRAMRESYRPSSQWKCFMAYGPSVYVRG